MARPRRRLTHLDHAGRARMVDVSAKPVTVREAVARGEVTMQPGTLARIAAGTVPKGDVLAVARLAGMMAAKRTAELIPLCHPLPLSHVDVSLAVDPPGARVIIEGRARGGGERPLPRRRLLQPADADRRPRPHHRRRASRGRARPPPPGPGARAPGAAARPRPRHVSGGERRGRPPAGYRGRPVRRLRRLPVSHRG